MTYLRKVWKFGQVIETDTGGRYTRKGMRNMKYL